MSKTDSQPWSERTWLMSIANWVANFCLERKLNFLSENKIQSFKMNSFIFCHFMDTLCDCSVVQQFYQTRVIDEFVLRGNAAILKCNLPSFVADFVYVEAWVADDGTEILPNNNDFGTCHRLPHQYLIKVYFWMLISINDPKWIQFDRKFTFLTTELFTVQFTAKKRKTKTKTKTKTTLHLHSESIDCLPEVRTLNENGQGFLP